MRSATIASCLLLSLGVAVAVCAAATPVHLPKTGQTTVYATGDDGYYQKGVSWPSPRFVNYAKGIIKDNLTGLYWMKDVGTSGPDACPMNESMSWQEALDCLACLNAIAYLGRRDWRLPNVNELESLLHAGENDSFLWLKNQGFTNLQHAVFWSSTTCAGNTDYAWLVDISDDIVTRLVPKTLAAAYVWPVQATSSTLWKTGQTTSYAKGDDGDLERGVAWSRYDRFTTQKVCSSSFGYSVVKDNLTGLLWYNDANLTSGEMTWQEAIEFANDATFCGYMDWRLPNRKELRSLIDYSKDDPALPQFVGIHDSEYWSSTRNEKFGSSVDMTDGGLWHDNLSQSCYVLLVRDDIVMEGVPGGIPNSPPAAPELTFPADGAWGEPTTVTLVWQAAEDPEGDAVSYDLYFCTDSDPEVCTPVPVVNAPAAAAGVGGVGMGYGLAALFLLLCGVVFLGGRRRVVGLCAVVAVAGMLVWACDGGDGGDGQLCVMHTVKDLDAGTTYFWKVVAKDSEGGMTSSDVWSFTTE